LLEDISKGLSDAELMDRHELSHAQLQKVFSQLLKAGYVAQEVLNGRRQAETKSSSVEFEGTGAPVKATESRSAQPPRPVPSESHSPVLMDDESRHPGTAKSSSSSLPYSREQAARFRRNGLILILASFGFMTMMIILSKLREGVEGGVFPNDGEGLALNSIATLGWLVTAIWGCFWRLRGLGQSGAWGIVAPLPGINLLVVEALPNRYEPQSFPRVLRVALVLGVLGACGIAWTIISRLL
jgi:hypothetical protein